MNIYIYICPPKKLDTVTIPRAQITVLKYHFPRKEIRLLGEVPSFSGLEQEDTRYKVQDEP